MANNSQIGLPPSPAGNGTGTNLTPAQVAANAAPQQGTNPAGGIGTTPTIIQSNPYAAPAAPANPADAAAPKSAAEISAATLRAEVSFLASDELDGRLTSV